MRFRMLGPLEVWDGETWVAVRSARLRVMLALLLIEAGRVVSVDRLADELWGSQLPARATATVRVYVGRLRQLLGGGSQSPLVTRGPGYQLLGDDSDSDVAVFQRLVADARAAKAAGRPEAAVEAYSDALALWRGPALADVPASHTVTAWARGWEDARLGALEDRLGIELDLGRHSEVVNELPRLVKEHPLRERLHACYMLALYRCGRRAEALAAYRDARQIIVDELGLEPGPDLRAIEHSILADDQSPAASGVLPTSPMTEPVKPSQLPAGTAGFTGRGAQLKRLDELLGGDGGIPAAVVISTIAGTAGVGKTALALQWAHRNRDRFPDGQLYASLRGYAGGPPLRPVEALAGFLAALGVPNDQIPVEQDQAAALYRTLVSGKRMLVLLDDARHPDQVRPLLPGTAGCLALVTSRDRLGGLVAHDGAVRLDLDPLSAGEAHALLARLLGPERLAVEPEAVAELANQCGFLPLALRIVAANLGRHTTIGDYTSRLRQDRLAALEVAGDPTDGVRAAFDHSYASLPEPARRLFRLLGLLPGADLTGPAAAALAGVPERDATRLLNLLASSHLVEERAPARYGLHDLLRDYARERAAAETAQPDRSDALGRLYGFYLHSVDVAAGHLYPEMLRLPVPAELTAGPAARIDDHTAALAWLDTELPNLAAAVGHALTRGPTWGAWRLADALRGYLMLHRHPLQWQDVARAAQAAAEADGDDQGVAAAHLSLAGVHWVAARIEPAIEHYTRALDLTRRAGWAEGEAATLGNLGLVHWTSGDPRQAVEHFVAALAIDERTGRLASQATNLINLGLVYGALGRLDLAVEQQLEALDSFRRIGSRSGELAALASLGETYHELGRLDEARDTLTQALALARQTGERLAEADTVRFLAGVERDLGRPGEARELCGTALRLASEVGDTRCEAEALVVQASTLSRKEHEAGAADCRRALELARRDGYRDTEARALAGLATARLHAGQPNQAAEHANQAFAIAHERGFRLVEAHARTIMATIDLRRGHLTRALDHAEQTLAIHTDTGQRLGQARTHLVAAEVLSASDRTDAARSHRELAQVILADTGGTGHSRGRCATEVDRV